MSNSIRDYLFNKLFFPKVVTIDKPGIIYTVYDRKFGRPAAKRRIIYFFEDILVNLQLETVKVLGKERTSELWYKIGKEVGIGYLLQANIKKVPSFLLRSIIDYIFSSFRSAGMSVAEEINFCSEESSLVLKGRENMVCRKSKIPNFSEGIVSGIFGSIVGKNTEAEAICNECPYKCKIITNPKIKKEFTYRYKKLKLPEQYNKINFPQEMDLPKNIKSLSDLLNFKKISLDKLEKFCFKKQTILPCEAVLIDIAVTNYQEINKLELFKKSIVDGAKKIAEVILKDKYSIKEKIGALTSMLGGFGWGIPYFKRGRNKIYFEFLYPPYSISGYLYQAFVVNGYLNHIFDKKLELYDIKVKIKPYTISMIYGI